MRTVQNFGYRFITLGLLFAVVAYAGTYYIITSLSGDAGAVITGDPEDNCATIETEPGSYQIYCYAFGQPDDRPGDQPPDVMGGEITANGCTLVPYDDVEAHVYHSPDFLTGHSHMEVASRQQVWDWTGECSPDTGCEGEGSGTNPQDCT